MIPRVSLRQAGVGSRHIFPAPRLLMSGYRGYVSQTRTKRSIIAVLPGPVADPHQSQQPLSPPNPDEYLKTLSRKELFSLGMIGCVTLNRRILDFVIKVFPYVPSGLVKFFISSLYCGGSTVEEVRQTGRALRERGANNMMLSLTIEDSEGVKNIDINYIVAETIRSLHEVLRPNLEEQLEKCQDVNSIPPGYLALKPSALVSNPVEVLLNFENPKWQAQREQLIDNCSRITEEVYKLNQELSLKYPDRKIPFFVSTIDAEKYALQKAGVYELQRILFSKFNPSSSPIVSCIGTWQLYLQDAGAHLAQEAARAQREGYKLGVKLVRGAYLHSEPDRNVIFPTKEDTDRNYNQVLAHVINDLLNNGENSIYGHLVVASHNYESQMLATSYLMSHGPSIGKFNVSLGQLLGMSEGAAYELIHRRGATNVIKYVPWGPPKETKDYLLRRLQENGDAVKSDNGWPLLKAVIRTVFRLS